MYKGIDKTTAEPVAIKISALSPEVIKSLKQEIDILSDVQCDYVVGFRGSYDWDGNLWLVMEYCDAGSVIDLI